MNTLLYWKLMMNIAVVLHLLVDKKYLISLMQSAVSPLTISLMHYSGITWNRIRIIYVSLSQVIILLEHCGLTT